MPYYIRVLGTNPSIPNLAVLREAANPAIIICEQGEEDDWQSLLLKSSTGLPIAIIERNPVRSGELGADELDEFIDEVSQYKPDSASAWLKKYLPKVQVIYAFQLLNGTKAEDGFSCLQQVYSSVWNHAGGLLQADGEGFSNESGETILWQFADYASGPWQVAVLARDESWIKFEIDLGNELHREAFKQGRVLEGI